MISLDPKVHWNACWYIAEKYYNKYFDESCSEWVVDNPSAALVATVRKAFFDDYVFAWAYLDVDVTCQASGGKLQRLAFAPCSFTRFKSKRLSITLLFFFVLYTSN